MGSVVEPLVALARDVTMTDTWELQQVRNIPIHLEKIAHDLLSQSLSDGGLFELSISMRAYLAAHDKKCKNRDPTAIRYSNGTTNFNP